MEYESKSRLNSRRKYESAHKLKSGKRYEPVVVLITQTKCEPIKQESKMPAEMKKPTDHSFIEEPALEEDRVDLLLRSDVREAAMTLAAKGKEGLPEVQYLVSLYYLVQNNRTRASRQALQLKKDEKPNKLIRYVGQRESRTEETIFSVLDIYTQNEPIGIANWTREIYGIGPVLAAGLMAHVPMEKTPGVAHLWSFAGLNPKAVWEKGEKRPWNADLKVLCWKIGRSFMNFSNRDKCFYGKLYRQEKEKIIAKNNQGDFAEYCKQRLLDKKWRKGTPTYIAYTTGKLPDGQIDARARRWAVKLFLSHWWDAYYILYFNKIPPIPYAIAILGHKDRIDPPIPYPIIKVVK